MMKKLFVLFFCALAFVSCKKKYDTVSTVVVPSMPTFTFPQGQYFSIPVGGTVPTVSVTAYDTILGENITVTDTGTVDNSTPGLYILTAIAKNKNGYTNTSAIYVAVTNVSPGIDLSGSYLRAATGQLVTISKKAAGLYLTDNVGGVLDIPGNAPFIIPAVFAQLDDTTLVLPPQPTSAGTLYATNATVTMGPADTTIQYKVINASFGTSLRTFQKQ
jgi:hypothetical protein